VNGPLHVHCGDCAAGVATRADLPGEVLPWRDSAAVGPCAADPDRHRRLRAEWWGVAESAIQQARLLPADRELVLWFGPDPWEQVALVEVLAGAPATALSLVPLDRGVGAMSPGDLAAPYEHRRDARDLADPMAALWSEFCLDDRPALRRTIARLGADDRLGHLAPALQRVLEDREQSRTERQVGALVESGVTALPELMRRLRALEAPAHGVWYGDEIVRRLRDRLQR
jgi:hypothetical protein